MNSKGVSSSLLSNVTDSSLENTQKEGRLGLIYIGESVVSCTSPVVLLDLVGGKSGNSIFFLFVFVFISLLYWLGVELTSLKLS